MSKPELGIVAGALPRGARPKSVPLDEAMMKRPRADAPPAHEASSDEERDVIPLLDGWLRRLERQSASRTDKRH